MPFKMPGAITVYDFVRETREDHSSPTTSNFVNRIPQCKETVTKLEEVSFFIKLCGGCVPRLSIFLPSTLLGNWGSL